MEAAATINVRLSEQLKQGGTKVLDRCGITPTELVRSVYRYMDRHQTVPECLDIAPQAEDNIYIKRRMLLRSFDSFEAIASTVDCKAERGRRVQEKYGDLL
jgi:antitoxin component of RelBE/YafQ-DinJ toxin-antitoxin module